METTRGQLNYSSPKHALQTAPGKRCHFKGQNLVEKNCLSPNVGPNVASSQCGAKMWLQAQMWWRLRNDGNVASNNVASKCGVKHKFGGASENVQNVASNNAASKCGVRHKCGGSPKCGVKQCGVKMWRQTLPLPNCLPGNVSSKKVFSGRHKSATLNACALRKKKSVA